MRAATLIITFLVLATLPPGARADEARLEVEGAGRRLTLDEAVQMARDRNRDLRAAREKLNQAKADIDRAWSVLLPTVAVQGKYTFNHPEAKLSFSPGPLQTLSAKVQQDMFQDLYVQNGKVPSPAVLSEIMELQNFCKNNPKSSECNTAPIVIQQQNQLDFIANANIPLIVPAAYPGLTAARQAFAAQEAGIVVTEAQLLSGVATAFYACAGAEEVVGALKNGLQVAGQTLDNARARFAAGVSTRVDVTRAEIVVVRAEQAMRSADDGVAAAYRGLATLIQLREPFRVVVGEAPPAMVEAPDALVDNGLRLRPEFRLIDHQLAAADATVLSSKLRWLPALSGFGLFRAFNAAGFTGQNWAVALGLQLDWLLYDGGVRDAQRHQFQSLVMETQLRREQLRDQVQDEIVNGRRALETRRKAVESARREVALAGETLKLARVQRDAGTVTQLDLLQAQDALVNAEVNVARARFDLALSDLQLRRAVGTFP